MVIYQGNAEIHITDSSTGNLPRKRRDTTEQEHRPRVPDARLILSFYCLFILYKKYLNSERIFTYYNDRTQLLFFKY